MLTDHELSVLMREHVAAFAAQFPESIGLVVLAVERVEVGATPPPAGTVIPVVWSNMAAEDTTAFIATLAAARPHVSRPD